MYSCIIELTCMCVFISMYVLYVDFSHRNTSGKRLSKSFYKENKLILLFSYPVIAF